MVYYLVYDKTDIFLSVDQMFHQKNQSASDSIWSQNSYLLSVFRSTSSTLIHRHDKMTKVLIKNIGHSPERRHTDKLSNFGARKTANCNVGYAAYTFLRPYIAIIKWYWLLAMFNNFYFFIFNINKLPSQVLHFAE